MISRIRDLLGIARRAGKLASGDSEVQAMLKKKKGSLMLLAEDAPSVQKRYIKWANDLNLPVLVTATKLEMGQSIGSSPRAVILIMDEGFAKAILEAGS